MNMAVTDGRQAVVLWYTTDESEGLSLYIRSGKKYVCEDGVCRMIDDGGQQETVIVASEPLTEELGWNEVPRNHMVLVYSDHRTELRKID